MVDDVALRAYYRAIAERPLPPGDPAYIQIYPQDSSDPVEKLATGVEWASNESAQIFSGFRGSGKSTELMRLQERLSGRGYTVVYCDMEDYLNLTTPVDVSDFLLSTCGALGEALANGPLKGRHFEREGYWTRIGAWMTKTNVVVDELGGDPYALKMSLKQDPTFRQRLQERMAGHLGALVTEARAWVQECAKAVDGAHPGKPLVLLLDSLEHIRGTTVNAEDVARSLVTLFFGHADKLRFANLHVVYSVPPWLKIKEPGICARFDAAVQIPCVAVRDRGGHPDRSACDKLHAAVAARGPWATLASDADRERLVLASGGHLRDLLRLVRAVLVEQRGRDWPAGEAVVTASIRQVRQHYLPLAQSDMAWLARVANTHTTQLQDGTQLPDLARYFDSLLVMTYQDGEEWWDVHPLVRDAVLAGAPAPSGV